MFRSRKSGRRIKGRKPARRASRTTPRRKTRLELIFRFLFGGPPKKSRAKPKRGRGWNAAGSVVYWGGVAGLWAAIILGGMIAW